MAKETRDALRRLTMKLCFAHSIVPQALVLKGLVISDRDSIGGGGFADIYKGTYRQVPVALKRLRVFLTLEESRRESLRRVSRISVSPSFVVVNIVQDILSRSSDMASIGPSTYPQSPWC